MDWLLQIALAAIPAILAITLHEAAHGYAALALGDDTARQAGRLSLNPIRHIDRVGTIILPGILLIGQLLTIGRVAFMFGWAKPVPVSAWKFANPRRGMMWVAMAGPAMNFLLAWLAALALHPVLGLGGRAGPMAIDFLLVFVAFNLGLGLFNLLPVPPLDGGRIMVGLLPEPAARVWARLERAGIALVLLLVFVLPALLREFGITYNPVMSLLHFVLAPAFALVFRAAGYDGATTALILRYIGVDGGS